MNRKLNILIIDDSLNFVEGLEMLLSKFHDCKIRNIYKASSGSEGIKIAKNKVVDLVFLDYSMPNMSGAEVAKYLNQINRYIKIVGLSFHNSNKVLEEMIFAGANNYIQKDELTISLLGKQLDEVTNQI